MKLPPSVWVAGSAPAGAKSVVATTAASGVKGRFVRVKAHKLVPAAATVRVLASQRFVPVSIYRVQPICDSGPLGDLCIPSPVLQDQELPILNTKSGYQRQWTLQGSAAPAPGLGALTVQPGAGVDYTAPGVLPATNPVTLKFESVNLKCGLRLVLSAKVRVVEDAWQGPLQAFIGSECVGAHQKAQSRWTLDAAQNTATRRVYRPTSGEAEAYWVGPPGCDYPVSPRTRSFQQAGANGELVVDESFSPARYTLELYTKWDAVMSWICPGGDATHPFAAGHVWQASGTPANDRIEGADNGLGERQWRLERPQ